MADRQLSWFALKVDARSESRASLALANLGYEVFSPTYPERRRYSDRFKIVATPVLSGYVLIRWDERDKGQVLSCPAVHSFVSVGEGPQPIPERAITDLVRMLANGGHPVPYFTAGDRIRVESGILAGIEGTYVRRGSGGLLLVSVDLIERSVAIQINEDQVSRLDRRSSVANSSLQVR